MKRNNTRSRRMNNKLHLKYGFTDNNINGAFGFLGSAMNAFSKPTLQYSPTTVSHNGPVSYQESVGPDSSLEYKALGAQNTQNTLAMASSGAKLGSSIAPGIGTAAGAVIGGIAGLFGGSARKRELAKMIAEQNKGIAATNNFNQSTALTDELQQDYAKKFGDTTNASLMNNGKTPFVPSKFGNAYVGKGESIVDGNTGNMTEVTKGSQVGVDDVSASIAPQDAVLGNLINPKTGNTFAKDAAPLSRMERKAQRNVERNSSIIAKNTADMVHRFTDPLKQQMIFDQAMVQHATDKGSKLHATNGYPNLVDYLKQNNPTYDFGMNLYNKPTDNTVIPNRPDNYTYPKTGNNTFNNILKGAGNIATKFGNSFGDITSNLADLSPILYNVYQGNQKAETVSPEQLVTTNPYASKAMNIMASRKYNVNPELDAINKYYRMQQYNDNASDTGVTRYTKLANNANLLNMIGQIYGKKQSADNSYLGEYANTMSSLGNEYASRMTAAKNSAYDMNLKNKAAKKNYMSTALSQLSEYSQGRRKAAQETDWMNRYFNLYHK